MSTLVTYAATELPDELSRRFEQGVAEIASSAREPSFLIDGGWRHADAVLVERAPWAHDETFGSFAAASPDDVDAAVRAAVAARRSWSGASDEERRATLARAAGLIERDRGRLAAAVALEVGKNRLEAIGEVDETIALIHFYSEQAAAGFEIPLARAAPADRHASAMRPFGVFGVIAPFNFPLALAAGPAVAAMLTGNTVVIKPAPTTCLVALLLGELLVEAGVPSGVVNVVTGGDDAGRALVEHPALDGLVFTGSYSVGQAILRRFGGGAGFSRPCIVEMGGKNPAIVTARADLQAAVQGIARSAFGLSGQKCSACSRVLVERSVHDELVAGLAAAAAEWRAAPPQDPDCDLGPVHTRSAFERFVRATELAEADGRVAFGGRSLARGKLGSGWYVEPTIVTDLPAGHVLSRDELFVPLVVVERVESVDEAIERANDQVYGLTAGLYSRDEAEIEAFLDRIEAGTLFVNRAAGATSGGWPGQQTYPGWKGSGSTYRGALGPRYVQQFLREQGRMVVGGD